MPIVTMRERVLAFFALVLIVGAVVLALFHQEQMKDDCRASGGFVTEVHGNGGNAWICSPRSDTPIILNTSPRGHLLR